MRTTSIRAAAAVLGLFLLAACGSSDGANGSSSGSGSSSSASTANAVLKSADSDLGKIVVDADGRTVYVFDKDTAGHFARQSPLHALFPSPAVSLSNT